jgi:hypothetical protein
MAKAPEQIVTSMRQRFAAAEAEISRLQEQLRSLETAV